MRHLTLLASLLLLTIPALHAQNAPAAPDADVQAKLQSISVDVKFDKAPIASVIDTLNKLAKAADPAKVGVKFVYHAPPPGSPTHDIISMSLTAVPLVELLHFITDQTGLQYTIKNGQVDLHAPPPAA